MRIDIKDLPLELQKQALRKLAEEDARREAGAKGSIVMNHPDSKAKAMDSIGSQRKRSATALDSSDSYGNDSYGEAEQRRVDLGEGNELHNIVNEYRPQSPSFRYGVNNNTNRGTHGDSSFMLDGMPSSSENPLALAMGSVKRRSKYNARKVTLPMPDGTDHTFDSQHEANVYGDLWLQEQAGEISELQIQVPFELLPRQVAPSGKIYRPCSYIADFVYKDSEGNRVVADAKGLKTDIYKLKKKLMLYKWGIEIREV